jgi:hypothetical protein
MSVQEFVNYKLNNRDDSDIDEYLFVFVDKDLRKRVLDEASARDKY